MLRALPVFAVVLAVVACVAEREYPSAPDAYQMPIGRTNGPAVQGDPGYATNIAVTQGRVRGDIGDITRFDAPAQQIDAWYDGGWQSTSITLTANDPAGRMGMIILDVEGFDLRRVPPGTYHFTASSVDPAVGTGDGYVDVTGCSSDPNSYYDEPSNDGDIVVQDTPDGREVTVQSNLPTVDGSATTAASGSFIIQ